MRPFPRFRCRSAASGHDARSLSRRGRCPPTCDVKRRDHTQPARARTAASSPSRHRARLSSSARTAHFMQKEFRAAARDRGHARGRDGARARALRRERARRAVVGDSVLCLPAGRAITRASSENSDRSLAQVPCTVEIASEYAIATRCRMRGSWSCVVCSQARRPTRCGVEARAVAPRPPAYAAICNVATSTMVRQPSASISRVPVTVIGVASTKAFTTQLTALFRFAAALAKLRGRLP